MIMRRKWIAYETMIIDDAVTQYQKSSMEVGLPINKILNTDVFLVSYPRSGNTWLRNIIAEIIYGESGTKLGDVGKYIPDIGKYNVDEMDLKFPRVIKSHDTYNETYRRVIYIIRDPRDVILSYYKYHSQLKYSSTFENFVIEVNNGNIWPGKCCDPVIGINSYI